MAAVLLIAILAAVAAVEVVTYTQTLTLTSYKQLTVTTTSASWTVYINDANKVQYIPGGDSEPTLDTTDPTTYSFSVATDSSKACAVEIDLETTVSTDFSLFQVTVLSQATSGTDWSPVTLYTTATGTTTASYLDGTTNTPVYLQQAVSTTTYYLVEVTYSYAGDTATSYTIDLQFTPYAVTLG